MFHLFKRAAASIPNAAAGKLRFFIDTDDRPKLKDENGNVIDLKTQDNFSGDYNDLTNKPNITGTLLTGLTTVAASAISATDSVIGAIAKLQANIETKADAANTLLLLGNKQNKLPTDGTAGQFLAHDLTFKTPAGGGDGIVWVALTRYFDFTTNLTTYDPPMIGKSSDGIIYIKGTFVFSQSPNTNAVFASVIPQTYRPEAMLALAGSGGYLAFEANVAVGQANAQPWQVRLLKYDPATTMLVIASPTGTSLNINSGTTLIIPQTRLGKGV